MVWSLHPLVLLGKTASNKSVFFWKVVKFCYGKSNGAFTSGYRMNTGNITGHSYIRSKRCHPRDSTYRYSIMCYVRLWYKWKQDVNKYCHTVSEMDDYSVFYSTIVLIPWKICTSIKCCTCWFVNKLCYVLILTIVNFNRYSLWWNFVSLQKRSPMRASTS